jgi:hypothetical protein
VAAKANIIFVKTIAMVTWALYEVNTKYIEFGVPLIVTGNLKNSFFMGGSVVQPGNSSCQPVSAEAHVLLRLPVPKF